MNATYYDILEVSPAASPETIRAAYRSLMQKHHPDRSGSKERALALNVAYETLADTQRRMAYDVQIRSQLPALAAVPVYVPETPRRRRRWPWIAALCTLPLLATGVYLANRPASGLMVVGTAPIEGDAEGLQVLIDLGSIRRAGDEAQMVMLFKPRDGKPFMLAGEPVVGASQVVAYQCRRRTYRSWQKKLVMADGTGVPLPDAHGEVAPSSAHDVALRRGCAAWWER
ncbi:MAG TPA: J domain-containing protein [Nevskiaceae bacterium]|nr:J domain-containing protein [Nevskiaceae bacterium]